MILILDHYDSFVHNIARYCQQLGAQTRVVRHDALTLEAIKMMAPAGIILSPGPCTPDQAGLAMALLEQAADLCPILGVCLGHQCIGAAFGGVVERAKTPMHGRASLIRHDGVGLFDGVANPMPVGRYHSLIVNPTPGMRLRIDAVSAEGEIMALSHPDLPIWGIQFHPESVLTVGGYRVLENFLARVPSPKTPA